MALKTNEFAHSFGPLRLKCDLTWSVRLSQWPIFLLGSANYSPMESFMRQVWGESFCIIISSVTGMVYRSQSSPAVWKALMRGFFSFLCLSLELCNCWVYPAFMDRLWRNNNSAPVKAGIKLCLSRLWKSPIYLTDLDSQNIQTHCQVSGGPLKIKKNHN